MVPISDLRLAEHDRRGRSALELVAVLLQVSAGDPAPQVSDRATGPGADDRVAEDRCWEQEAEQRPDAGTGPHPCWVGFSVFVTCTLPSSSLRITAESKVPIAPRAWRSNTAS